MKIRTSHPTDAPTARLAWWAALACAAIVTAACGSTAPKADLDAEAFGRAAPSAASTVATPSTAQPTAPVSAGEGLATATAPSGSSGAATQAAPSGTSGTPTVAARSAVSAKGGASAAPSGTPVGSPAPRSSSAGPAGGSAGGAPSTPGQGAAPAAPVVAPGEKGEIVVAAIGTESGPIGAATLPIQQAARAFVADANARGGLAGHKVRYIIADDEGDPNKALSLARRMVDQDKAVAFFANHGPTTAQAIVPLLEERKIPSIAACICSTAEAKSPMAFYAGPDGDLGMTWSHIAPLKAFAPNVKKVSVMFCREAAVCLNYRNRINEHQKEWGLEIVHEAQPSLAQPDFTAEVIAARNAGAEGIIVVMENASNIRIARAAHRQGWNPALATQGTGVEARLLADGGKDAEGIMAGGFGLDWNSPKMADYVAAMKRHVAGGILGSFGTNVWATGKLFEKIAQGFPANPTSADILTGLYSLNGETLGGLIPPTTFVPGKPSGNNCAVPLQVQNGKFVSAGNPDEYVCLPGWKPATK